MLKTEKSSVETRRHWAAQKQACLYNLLGWFVLRIDLTVGNPGMCRVTQIQNGCLTSVPDTENFAQNCRAQSVVEVSLTLRNVLTKPWVFCEWTKFL